MNRSLSELTVYLEGLQEDIENMFNNDPGHTSLIFLTLIRSFIKSDAPDLYDEYEDIIYRLKERLKQ